MCEIYACEHAYPLVLALAGMSGNLAQCILLSCTVSMERNKCVHFFCKESKIALNYYFFYIYEHSDQLFFPTFFFSRYMNLID